MWGGDSARKWHLLVDSAISFSFSEAHRDSYDQRGKAWKKKRAMESEKLEPG